MDAARARAAAGADRARAQLRSATGCATRSTRVAALTHPLLEVRGPRRRAIAGRAAARHARGRRRDRSSSRRGARLGIVGESGSGKTQLALALLGAVAARRARRRQHPLRTASELVGAPAAALRRAARRPHRHRVPGSDDPADPHLRSARSSPRCCAAHRDLGRRGARARALAMLARVRCRTPRAARRSTRTSSPGGMRQRVMIAMALLVRPGAADRRRADHGARRHGAGADPRAARASCRELRHGAPARQPRPRASSRGLCDAIGGDVRRAASSSRAPRARVLAAPAAPVHRGAARARARRSRARSMRRCRRSRAPAGAGRAAAGLRVRAALSARDRALPRPSAAARGGRRRPARLPRAARRGARRE